VTAALTGQGEGRLADNIAYFARALRAAGLPVGPGAVLDAIAAVEAARIGSRADFYWTLHAVFVKRHEHSILFDQAFRVFWRRRALIEKLIAQMSPIAPGGAKEEKKPQAGALRVAEALATPRQEKAGPVEKTEFTARLTVSDREVLKAKDFAQMSAAEAAAAKRLIAEMSLPDDEVTTRRFLSDPRGRRIDPRRTFRRSLRGGGAAIDLAFRSPAVRHAPVVALMDISGSGTRREARTGLGGWNAHRPCAQRLQPPLVSSGARPGRYRRTLHRWARTGGDL
jgi:uncharacterized protein with von Willebrand factor type A (vWA) domain